MRNIDEYTPVELATLATIIGIEIAFKFNTPQQQNVVANFLFGIAQSIFIIASQNLNLIAVKENQNGDTGTTNLSDANKKLQKQIDELKKSMKNIKDIMDKK